MVAGADALVVCGVPFGEGNIVNLDLASYALANGKPAFIMGNIGERDYTPDGKASLKARQLAAMGALKWDTMTDLLRMLPSSETSAPASR